MFDKLGDDVLFDIMASLGPRPILTLRQVNKRLYGLSKAHFFWAKTVHTMMKDLKLPASFYNTQAMGQEELEKIALAPTRFAKIMSSSTINKSPVKVRSLLASGLPSRAEVALVPGGRWLITGDTRGTIELWDLEALNNRSAKDENKEGGFDMTSTVSLGLASHSIREIQLQADTDPNSAILLVAAVEEFEPGDWFVLRVKFPEDGTPTLTKLVEVHGDVCFGSTLLWGDYVVSSIFGQDGSIVVWNWKEDTWGGIQDPQLSVGEWASSSPAIVHPPHITIATNRPIFYTYPLPPLVPRPKTPGAFPTFTKVEAARTSDKYSSLGINFSTPLATHGWVRDETKAETTPVLLRCAGHIINTTGEFLAFSRDREGSLTLLNRHTTGRFTGDVVSQVTGNGDYLLTSYLTFQDGLVAVIQPLGSVGSPVTRIWGDLQTLQGKTEYGNNFSGHTWDPVTGRVCIHIGYGNVRVLDLALP